MPYPHTFLITGSPGVGKTTLVIRLAESLASKNPMGFYTREIRAGRTRIGFELVGFEGRTAVLSHVQFPGPFRVGRYGVDLAGLDAFLSGLKVPDSEKVPVIIDEIGKMECFSLKFRTLVTDLLDSRNPLIATIAQRGDRFIETIEARDDCTLYTLTKGNRDTLFHSILADAGREYCLY